MGMARRVAPDARVLLPQGIGNYTERQPDGGREGMQQLGQEPMVFFAPEDAHTARAAGVEFARPLAGAPPAWFMLALGEQGLIIREAVERYGCSAQTAEEAASAFYGGA